MRLFEMRNEETGAADLHPLSGIVLVTAESEEAAMDAIRAALGTPDDPFPAPGTVVFNDLGQHAGPEEPGSVFVNGYRIAC